MKDIYYSKLHRLSYRNKLGKIEVLVYGDALEDVYFVEDGYVYINEANYVYNPAEGWGSSSKRIGSKNDIKLIEVLPFDKDFNKHLGILEKISQVPKEELRSDQIEAITNNIIYIRGYLYSKRADYIRSECVQLCN